MAIFDNIVSFSPNFKGYSGNPPTTKTEYDALDCWTDKSQAPSWSSVSSDMALEKVRVNRREAYPDLGEQLDMLFHDMSADKGSKTGEWYKAIAKVKSDNPKE